MKISVLRSGALMMNVISAITTDAFDFNIISAAKWHNIFKSKNQ
jgi:hypothetical protein